MCDACASLHDHELGPKRFMRRHLLISLTLVAALTATACYGLLLWREPFSDAADYVALGQRLTVDGVYQDDNGAATSYRPPGFPLLVALCQAISSQGHWPVSSQRVRPTPKSWHMS